MEKPFGIVLLVGLLLAPAVAQGDGFSSIIDGGRIKISLSYPAEVKLGTCFSLQFQATFLSSVAVERMRLTVQYVSEAGTVTILSDTIVGSITSFPSGTIISKTYSVCVPAAVRRDPLVVAVFYANYSRGAMFEPLTHNWMLAVVRDRTYQEVLNQLADAENRLASLRRTVEELQSQVNTLRTQLEQALRESTRLSTSLEEARREYGRLEARYQTLSNEYKALNDRYTNTLGELRALQALYESLQRENRALSENYRSLLSDYRNLTREFTALQASYSQLQTLYENLSNRHDAARQQIGVLQSQLDETKASLQDLRLQYVSLSGENALHRNLAYVQAFILVGVAAWLASLAVSRRLRKSRVNMHALPPPPPPPPEPEKRI
ncbi:MAG: hypothetical protein NZ570_05485 [Candidatus Caldarchaeum sp.]|nr:hypothetical protein [Candidatus Caldarchaeum sp.]MCS7137611.1 hypothetical protein [Candidatus Caldarchaeum sp.]MDW7978059.1 hypothetical protein [Candidatus Caldarchaeum sp.]MDW8359171.1 hypothetical protein [Candidatus Caldarchaeum sp.]